jgi:5'-3' exonuclease, N-terminal resolvase-like domain
MKLLIDGDTIVYRAAFACEKSKYLVEYNDARKTSDKFDDKKTATASMESTDILWSRKEIEPLENCLNIVNNIMANIFKATGTEDYQVYLTGKNNFRDKIAVTKPYKGNREFTEKPVYYKQVRDFLITKWGALVIDGMEADDAIGIASTKDTCIVSNDKDLDQIPGKHYDFTIGLLYDVPAKDAVKFFYQQLLSGDATDNIPGIPGIGKQKAAKLLDGCTSPPACAAVVAEEYQSLPVTPKDCMEYLKEQALLIWIKRKEDKDEEPLIWRHLNSDQNLKSA